MKYIILCDSANSQPFIIPRQLIEINGEKLVDRTIRLLKENKVNNIVITSHDKRFDDLGVERYEPLYNDYDPVLKKGYWLSAFPIELLNEPITFLFGDVYYSEKAIKTIIKNETNGILFFCTYNNKDKRYIKNHDEPLAFKVADYNLFKKHIDLVKAYKDNNLCCREPITWELYRSINGLDINKHVLTKNYIVINDESCDIDSLNDIIKLKAKLGGLKMIKCEVVKNFSLEKFNELVNLTRGSGKNEEGKLYVKDTFECDEEMAKYLSGDNKYKSAFVVILEVVPEVKKDDNKKEEIKEEKKVKKTNKKKKDK